MTTYNRIAAFTAIAAVGLSAMLASSAVAADRHYDRDDHDFIVALTGDRTLLLINDERVVRRINVSGIPSRLAGIDVRPADRLLYGLVENGQVYTINLGNGAATLRSTLSVTLPATQLSIDFNPVVDRLRIVGADGTNLRADVDTGATLVDLAINYALPNPFGGSGIPSVIGVAYSNSRGTPLTTLLYDIDDLTDALYLQLPPNNGTLVPVGQLGVVVGPLLGFDIATSRRGENQGLVVSGDRLLEIDLAGGAVIERDRIRGVGDSPLRDVAALIR